MKPSEKETNNSETHEDPLVSIAQYSYKCRKCETPHAEWDTCYGEMEHQKQHSGFEYVKVVCGCGAETVLVSTHTRFNQRYTLVGRLMYAPDELADAQRSYGALESSIKK